MGMYDEICARCPVCGCANYLQSKAGPCQLKSYGLHNAPPEVVASLCGERFECEGCKSVLTVRVRTEAWITVERPEGDNSERRPE